MRIEKISQITHTELRRVATDLETAARRLSGISLDDLDYERDAYDTLQTVRRDIEAYELSVLRLIADVGEIVSDDDEVED
jgi:hypothetical protein